MDINHLCDFLTIAKLGSLTRAAEELFISQSCLSKRIKVLEKNLGIELFDRSRRQIALTEAGEALLPHALQVCEAHDALANVVNELTRKQNNAIKIASLPVMIHYYIPNTIADFQLGNPDIHVTLSEAEPFEIPQLLESGECDFAFARRITLDGTGFEFARYFDDHLVAILPREHPLAREPQIELQQLREERFLFLSQITRMYDFCFNLCLDAGFTPQVVHTGRWPDNLIELVANSMGVSLLMNGYVDYLEDDRVRGVEVSPRVDGTFYLVRLKGRRMSPAAQQFWSSITRSKAARATIRE